MAAGIDRDLLQQLLWEQRYGDDLVDINQQELAGHLAVTKHTMSRVIARMIEEERLAAAGGHTYRVYDPEMLERARSQSRGR